ncbi:MBL fold metallo-hydrolase [Catellatospora tritici]|uniref:MBL fold metallo-hydrolase n=1 Tax=Catellatospora tritici TaxID=2851566 RepID=UPI001C2D42C9|nr:MBL fold metallo-hydrolase [Catellatospora tritici]MBV1849537.1 MBL fold metallo-hydrolase [Catellatospora tritici]MBV1854109.1 MBL fold metallo-hydrolase [Catellatospora tritici]
MSSRAQPIVFATQPPVARPLDVSWIHGSPSAKYNTDPDLQVYAHDEHTYILRQNKAVHYEAPFLFLLFGNDRAVLIDTGATANPEHMPLRTVVDELIADWLARHPRPGYRLLVLHTHSHGDHTAGDGQFADRPDTELVGAKREPAHAFFGFDTDPDRTALLDLGGRVLECLAIPGHHDASVSFYDPHTGFLLTGDTVYPGRLYVQDWAAFGRSIDRLVEFAERRPVTHVLGCHIEMSTTPGQDYPVGWNYQPDEPPLEMTVEHLRQVQRAVAEVGDRRGRHPYQDFVIDRTNG